MPLFSRFYASFGYVRKIFPPRGLKYSLFPWALCNRVRILLVILTKIKQFRQSCKMATGSSFRFLWHANCTIATVTMTSKSFQNSTQFSRLMSSAIRVYVIISFSVTAGCLQMKFHYSPQHCLLFAGSEKSYFEISNPVTGTCMEQV